MSYGTTLLLSDPQQVKSHNGDKLFIPQKDWHMPPLLTWVPKWNGTGSLLSVAEASEVGINGCWSHLLNWKHNKLNVSNFSKAIRNQDMGEWLKETKNEAQFKSTACWLQMTEFPTKRVQGSHNYMGYKEKSNGTCWRRLNSRGYKQEIGSCHASDSIATLVTNTITVELILTLICSNPTWTEEIFPRQIWEWRGILYWSPYTSMSNQAPINHVTAHSNSPASFSTIDLMTLLLFACCWLFPCQANCPSFALCTCLLFSLIVC